MHHTINAEARTEVRQLHIRYILTKTKTLLFQLKTKLADTLNLKLGPLKS